MPLALVDSLGYAGWKVILGLLPAFVADWLWSHSDCCIYQELEPLKVPNTTFNNNQITCVYLKGKLASAVSSLLLRPCAEDGPVTDPM